MTDVDVVIVSYNSRELLLRSCASVAAIEDRASIIVVDNASTDGSAEAVRSHAPNARLIELAENTGFARAVNLGAATGDAPHILLLNSDAELVGDAYERMAEELGRGRIGAVGPRIRDRDGRLELSTGRRLRPLNEAKFKVVEALYRDGSGPAAPWLERHYARARTTRSLSAACLLLRREAFEQVGGFDERFFLYAEDVDLCARLRRAGWTLRYRADAVALHERGGSSAPSEVVERHYRASQLAFYAKHRGALSNAVVRSWLGLRYRVAARFGPPARRARARRMLAALSGGAPGRADGLDGTHE